jgi:hypothetical protein
MEISQTADKSAARVIVETPVDNEYCAARQNLQAQLKQHGFLLDSQHGGEIPQALPVDVCRLCLRWLLPLSSPRATAFAVGEIS